MVFVILPAVVALAIKLFILWYSRNSATNQTVFSTLVFVFALHNLSEIGLFLHFFAGSNAEYILRCYYVLTYFVLASMLVYAITLSNTGKLKFLQFAIFIFSGLLASYTLYSDQIISGFTPLKYAITAIKGGQYWIFQTFVLSTLMLVVVILIRGYLTAKNHLKQVKCLYALFALSPIVIVSGATVILMKIGVPVNAMVVVPIASTLLIVITLYSERKHGITDIRQYLPMSLEQRTIRKINKVVSRYLMDDASHKETRKEIERLLVNHKRTKENNNMTDVAKSMKESRSNAYQIMRRLGIEREKR